MGGFGRQAGVAKSGTLEEFGGVIRSVAVPVNCKLALGVALPTRTGGSLPPILNT